MQHRVFDRAARQGFLLCCWCGVLALMVIACGSGPIAPERESGGDSADRHQNALLPALAPTATASACPALPPILQLVSHCGDVAIDGQSDADLYAGIHVIYGDLTIRAGRKKLATLSGVDHYKAGRTFSMPDLQRVTGTVTLDTDRTQTVMFPKLASIGGNLNLTMRYFLAASDAMSVATSQPVTSRLDTPLLTTVGDSIALTGENDPWLDGLYGDYDFGLTQVDSLGGGVSLVNAKNARTRGLASLVSIPGGVQVSWPGPLDLVAPSLLPATKTVGGDVLLSSISFTDAFMVSLERVAGSLTIEHYGLPTTGTDLSKQALVRNHPFPLLAEVGGDLTWRQASPSDCARPQLKSLRRVRGTIRFLGTEMRGKMGQTGSDSLLAGGVEISNSWGANPFFPDLRLTATATVVVHDNPDLCPCRVAKLQANLAQAGWTGSIAASNNNPGCTSCSACNP